MKKFLYTFTLLIVMFIITACNDSSTNISRRMNNTKSVDDVINEQIAKESGANSSNDTKDNTDVSGQDISDTKESDTDDKDNIEKNDTIIDNSAVDTINNTLSDAETQAADTTHDDIYVDLTMLSSTLIFSEVYNMVSAPDKYIGKKIRMNGNAAIYHDDYDGNDYYACIIKDATACCSQGIEFVLKEGDYPEADAPITVTGIFSSYDINGQTYYTLKDAVLE